MKHLFLPHPDTHQKAKLLSWQALSLYILIFMTLQLSLHMLAKFQPGVLGTTSNINQQRVIELTNIERANLNLPPLKQNSKLAQAASEKAKNMFAENYWAHFSPSGKDPWGFIVSSGYKFSYAGENLARNFYNSGDVVKAWMASVSHKDNILSPKYKEIGIAVEDGVLNGQSTTLVVQMFGSPVDAIALVNPNPIVSPTAIVDLGGEKVTLTPQQLEETAPVVASFRSNPQPQPTFIIDSFAISKVVGLSLFALLAILILIDLYMIRRRGVVRISSRHLPHMAILGLAATMLLNISPGSIL